MKLLCLRTMSLGLLTMVAACTSKTPGAPSAGPETDPPKTGEVGDDGKGSANDPPSKETKPTLNTGPLTAPFACGTDGIYNEPRPGEAVAELLRAAAGWDALEERPAAPTGLVSLLRAGEPCSGAVDKDACKTAFAQLSSGGEALRPGFDEDDIVVAFLDGGAKPTGYYLAYTKGDTVGKVSNASDLRAAFPTINTPAVALLQAHAAGYRVECHRADGWLREETAGWILVASRDHHRRCFRTDVLLFVRRDGTTEERQAIEDQPDPCP